MQSGRLTKVAGVIEQNVIEQNVIEQNVIEQNVIDQNVKGGRKEEC